MNNITRWDPFREMLTLRNAMDRMFDNAFFESADGLQPAGWAPAVDVSEKENEFVVKASLPGIDPQNLEITFSGKTLSIKGEYQEEKESDESHYHLRERRAGSFARSLTLPTSINADAIEAGYDAGVLTLRLPKVEEAKPKRIAIRNLDSSKMIEGKATDVNLKK